MLLKIVRGATVDQCNMPYRPRDQTAVQQIANAHDTIDSFLYQIDRAVRGTQCELQSRVTALETWQGRRDQPAGYATWHIDIQAPRHLALMRLEQLLDVIGIRE